MRAQAKRQDVQQLLKGVTNACTFLRPTVLVQLLEDLGAGEIEGRVGEDGALPTNLTNQ